jgi:hypothetical protein
MSFPTFPNEKNVLNNFFVLQTRTEGNKKNEKFWDKIGHLSFGGLESSKKNERRFQFFDGQV